MTLRFTLPVPVFLTCFPEDRSQLSSGKNFNKTSWDPYVLISNRELEKTSVMALSLQVVFNGNLYNWLT